VDRALLPRARRRACWRRPVKLRAPGKAMKVRKDLIDNPRARHAPRRSCPSSEERQDGARGVLLLLHLCGTGKRGRTRSSYSAAQSRDQAAILVQPGRENRAPVGRAVLMSSVIPRHGQASLLPGAGTLYQGAVAEASKGLRPLPVFIVPMTNLGR